MKEMIFEDKFSKVIIHTSQRCSGYVASTYLPENWGGTYCGCEHISYDKLDEYIRTRLDDYKRIK